jgi:hypothetical protein
MRQAFFDNQPESKPVSYLCQKIRDKDRHTRAGHSEQDAVLRYELRTGVFKDLEPIKWYLWHGKIFQALNDLQSLENDLDAAAFESKDENSQRLLKGIEELHTCVERNREFVPNYGERYRDGDSFQRKCIKYRG